MRHGALIQSTRLRGANLKTCRIPQARFSLKVGKLLNISANVEVFGYCDVLIRAMNRNSITAYQNFDKIDRRSGYRIDELF